MQERVLVASRRAIGFHTLTFGVLLALCLCWLVAGLVLFAAAPGIWRGPLGRLAGVFVAAAVGAVASAGALVASLVRVARPYRLLISHDGLVVERSAEPPLRISWTGVQEFYVTGDGQSPCISIRFDREHSLSGLAMGGGLGTEEVLPVGEFDMSAYSIAELLNQALREGVEPSPVSVPIPAPTPVQQPPIVS